MMSKHIPISDIRVDYSKNPRGEIDEDSIDELIDSIRSVRELSGTQRTLLQPVVVRPINDDEYGYELRFGYRRYAAFHKAYTASKTKDPWAASIPAIIDDYDMDDEEAAAPLAFALIENVQRMDMSPIDEALAIKTLLEDHKLKQKDVAKLLGKSGGWVSQRMALTNLAPEVQAALAANKIGHSHARELNKVESHDTQRELLKQGLKEDWQVDDWKKNADSARRKERKEAKEEEEPTGKPEEKEELKLRPTTPDDNGGYSVRRSPAEIKKVQEDIEWEEDVDESPYKKGIRDALLWVLGLSDSLTEESD